ncbi:MAG: phosphatidylserine decarboxylase family protein [Deltaproteobacteria bacterium]|nr:MAG: phosphatidylserine decarboxylase family protein [Deltaproteobacteria bacterium]
MQTSNPWYDTTRQSAFPIAKPGYGFIAAAVFVTLTAALLGWKPLAVIGLVFAAFTAYFFRDPDRLIPSEPGLLVSPADGKIIVSETVADNPVTGGPAVKISVFMSVFNVHVNRIPASGVVEDIVYHAGSFVNAAFDKASDKNERNAVIFQTDTGIRYGVVQIAGLIARRIICGLKPGDRVTRGNRFGMICFGSRLDLYLPADFKPAICMGQKVKAGATVLGTFSLCQTDEAGSSEGGVQAN